VRYAIRIFIGFTLILSALHAQNKSNAATVAAVLEKSGTTYTKVGDGVWQVNFKGKSVGEFSVRLAIGDDILVALAKIADRKDLALQGPFLVKLLELNHHMDSVKLALSEDMLYIRLDTPIRILDDRQLKYILDQVSAADEAYPEIKQYLPK
jgi:hypothetical protein